jgi:formylglycine-generating enzyme required for sulfatase activity
MAEGVLGEPDSPIPILITLPSLASRLLAEPGSSLYEYLDNVGEPLQIKELGAEVRKLARRGRMVFMFDGSDEVPEAAREQVYDLINSGVYSAAGNRVVVSSRRVGAARFVGYTRLEMAPLTVADQRRLMLSVCGEEKTKQLLLEISARTELRDIARVPMMLTVLALVARESPESSTDFLQRHSDLFRIASRLLLEGRHRRKKGVIDSYRAERVLSVASLILHVASASGAGNEVFHDTEVESAVSSADAVDLAPWKSPRDFVADVSSASNIVYPVDALHTKYRYLHRTMREFFAASALARYPSEDRRRVVSTIVDQQPWAEVLVLLGGLVTDVDDYLRQLFTGPPDLALRALKEVSSLEPAVALQALQQRPTSLHTRRGVFTELTRKLAPDALVQVLWAYLEQSNADILRADLYFIQEVLRGVETDVARQVEGQLFKYIPACPPNLFSLPPFPSMADPYWCQVSAGQCLIGAAPDDPERPPWVPPLTMLDIPAFEISRVPITNVIYEYFDPAHRLTRNFQEELELRELDHHPAVGISWYEAEIFCRWAARAVPGLRLPTECEWEKAASWAGDRKLRFPWGDDWDPQRLNTWESGPNRTTQVGDYPAGASPCGALDMAGNVWEWCLDWFADDLGGLIAAAQTAQQVPYSVPTGERRVDRGGGWYHDVGRPATFLRAADDPADRFSHCGFRVVRSPIQVSRGLDLGREPPGPAKD